MGTLFDLQEHGGNGTVKIGISSNFPSLFLPIFHPLWKLFLHFHPNLLMIPQFPQFPPFNPSFHTPESWFGELVSLVAVSVGARLDHRGEVESLTPHHRDIGVGGLCEGKWAMGPCSGK